MTESRSAQIVRRDPHDSDARRRLGNLLEMKGDHGAAVAELWKAVHSGCRPPTCNPETLMELKRALQKLRERGKPWCEFWAALRSEPRFALRRIKLALFTGELKLSEALRLPADPIGARIDLCAALFLRGDFDGGWDEYKKIPREQYGCTPAIGTAEAHNKLGEAIALAESLGRGSVFGEAILEFRRAIRLQPNFAQAHYNLARILAGKWGRDRLSYALPEVRTLEELEEPEEALSEFKEAVRLDPINSEFRAALGRALLYAPFSPFLRPPPSEALTEILEAIRLKHPDPTIHDDLVAALEDQAAWERAEAEGREAIRLNPNDDAAHSRLALALSQTGNIDGAINELREAVRLGPSHARHHYNLGQALQRRGNLNQALEELKTAHALSPGVYEIEVAYSLAKADVESAGDP